jgi:hypothetical protein
MGVSATIYPTSVLQNTRFLIAFQTLTGNAASFIPIKIIQTVCQIDFPQTRLEDSALAEKGLPPFSRGPGYPKCGSSPMPTVIMRQKSHADPVTCTPARIVSRAHRSIFANSPSLFHPAGTNELISPTGMQGPP